MYNDAVSIASEAGRRVDEGKKVIFTGHSYVGVPMTQSVKDLRMEERRE